MKFLNLLIILLVASSCYTPNNESDLYGKYVPIGYNNTHDTIELKSNNRYRQKIYSKANKLIRIQEGSWSYKNTGSIRFDSFFVNLDRDVEQYPELLDDTIDVTTSVTKRNTMIRFCVGYLDNENCYEKLADVE